MRKEVVEYEDYDGNKRKETMYFNLSTAEVTQMSLVFGGSIVEYLNAIVDAGDIPAMADFFAKILDSSYGEKSQDGKLFVKGPEVLGHFKYSPAYDIIYNRLINDKDYTDAFFKDVIPQKKQEEKKFIPK